MRSFSAFRTVYSQKSTQLVSDSGELGMWDRSRALAFAEALDDRTVEVTQLTTMLADGAKQAS